MADLVIDTKGLTKRFDTRSGATPSGAIDIRHRTGYLPGGPRLPAKPATGQFLRHLASLPATSGLKRRDVEL